MTASEPVLRLRGGGNAHPSGGRRDDDRERLVPEQTGPSRQRMYYGTQSGSEVQRATKEAKRHVQQRELEPVNRMFDDARQKHVAASADLNTMNAHIRHLGNQMRQHDLNPARRLEIEAQLKTAQDDFEAKRREVNDANKQLDALRRYLILQHNLKSYGLI
jgi:hypothetical protein